MLYNLSYLKHSLHILNDYLIYRRIYETASACYSSKIYMLSYSNKFILLLLKMYPHELELLPFWGWGRLCSSHLSWILPLMLLTGCSRVKPRGARTPLRVSRIYSTAAPLHLTTTCYMGVPDLATTKL